MIKNKKGFTPHLSQKDGVNIPISLSRKKGAGFTLIELLIVIAIISILAAAIVVGINPARHFRTARNATRWSQMNAIATAIYSYAVDNNGVFPDDPDPAKDCIGPEGFPVDIITDPADPNYWCCDGGVPILVPDYIHVLPNPPIDGEVYRIEFEGEAIKITSSATEAIEDGIELTQ